MIAERLMLAALWLWIACATAAYLRQFADLIEILLHRMPWLL